MQSSVNPVLVMVSWCQYITVNSESVINDLKMTNTHKHLSDTSNKNSGQMNVNTLNCYCWKRFIGLYRWRG